MYVCMLRDAFQQIRADRDRDFVAAGEALDKGVLCHRETDRRKVDRRRLSGRQVQAECVCQDRFQSIFRISDLRTQRWKRQGARPQTALSPRVNQRVRCQNV
jgi:hypothetical protein